MLREAPVSAVQEELHRRWRRRSPLYLLLALVALLGLLAAMAGTTSPGA